MHFFIADEHYGHAKIIKHRNRPFKNVHEMDEAIIYNHNLVVDKDSIVIHAGDFCWAKSYKEAQGYFDRLNGNHIFIKGSHDDWINRNKSIQIWEKLIDDAFIVVCHYPMHTWNKSHYNSWHLYGHSHMDLNLTGKRYCISVENTNYTPVSFENIKSIMESKGNNPNFIVPAKRNY